MYFKYQFWEWMPGPLPGYQMNLFFFGMGLVYTFIIFGLWYRVTSILAFAGFFYWFNLDSTHHLNHFYLVSLVSFFNMFLPLHLNTSLDAIRKPNLRVSKVPKWTISTLLLQISVPYFFGGIAKLNYDWLHGEPMRVWLLEMYPQGHIFTSWWAPYFFSWGGIAYDTSVVPMLLWKPTRALAVAGTIFFHLMNANMFQIGIFPWFMLLSTPLFFEPHKLEWVFSLEWIFAEPVKTSEMLITPHKRRPRVKWLLSMVIAYHFFMPFRHHLYPGYTGWTEEGHLYSWHMKLRTKRGSAHFTVKLEDGIELEVDNSQFLTKRQNEKMPTRPYMLLQYAHYLCKTYSEVINEPVEVYVNNMVSLNGRRAQKCVNPTVDLCKAKQTMITPVDWILPLRIPLWDQNMDSLVSKVKKKQGMVFVGTKAFKMKSRELKAGIVTRYVANETSWKVKFNDSGDEEDFSAQKLAESHWLQAQYEHSSPNLIGTYDGEL